MATAKKEVKEKDIKVKYFKCPIELDEKIKEYSDESGLKEDRIIRNALEFYLKHVEETKEV